METLSIPVSDFISRCMECRFW